MSDNTKIEWADRSWNPLLGCERVSSGCDGCYAISTATIRAGNPHPKVAAAFAGLTERRDGRIDWTGQINLLPDRLSQPLSWRKPSKVFVNSQSDLFHKDVPTEFIARVFAVMAMAPQHTFQILTKRHGRMRSLLNSPSFHILVLDQAYLLVVGEIPGAQVPRWVATEYHRRRDAAQRGDADSALPSWPLSNVHLGVSVEDQKSADLRIPALLDTPAAVRWLSMEPLLGPVNLTKWIGERDGCNPVSRGSSSSSGGTWGPSNRSAGKGLEGSHPEARPLVGPTSGHTVRSAQSGEPDGEVLPGPRDGSRETLARLGSPLGLAALSRTNPRGVDGESHERDLDGQPTGEPGASDAVGAGSPRSTGTPSWSTQPARHQEPDGETNLRGSRGDSSTQGCGRTAVDTCEPVRRPIPAHLADCQGRSSISWIVAGGESGPKARPMHPDWARSLRDQCVAADVPFFFKQWGEWAPNGWRAIGYLDPKRERLVGEPVDDLGHREVIERMGKKAAGRELDGRTWDECPADRTAVPA